MGLPGRSLGEQGDKLLLKGSRLLFRAGWNAFLLAGYLSPIIRWAPLLLRRRALLLRGLLLLRRWALLLRWGLLPRTRPYRFEGCLGLNRLDVRIDRFDDRFDIRT